MNASSKLAILLGSFLTHVVGAQDIDLNLSLGQQLSWTTEENRSYQLQWSNSDEFVWNDIGAVITGDGSEHSFYDDSVTSSRIYRVVETTSSLSANSSELANGSFENGVGIVANSWTSSNPGLLIRSDAEANTGLYSMHATIENVGDTPASVQLIQTTSDEGGAITAGNSYHLAFWVKEIRFGVSYVQQYQVQWLDSNNEVVGTSDTQSFNTTANTWEEVTEENLIAPEEAEKARVVFNFVTGAVAGGLGEVYIDDVSLVSAEAGEGVTESTTVLNVEVGGGAELTWNTVFGVPYQLFSSVDLDSWEAVGDEMIGDGTDFSVVLNREISKRFYKVEFAGDGGVVSTNIVSLFNASTALEPEILVETDTALITYMADRARDRHAREDMFNAYDHYLPWYWEERTLNLEIIDEVAKGGSEITFNYTTQGVLGAPEFRAFFLGVNTVAEYQLNLLADLVGPRQYTATISSNIREQRELQVGDRIELEISQFLDSPANGRSNYYGTTFLYVVGEGVVPWEGRGELLDSFPLPKTAWLGGLTTLPYQYSNEPEHRFKQTAGNIAPVSIQPFMEGRRLHHTDFQDGSHSEGGNPIFDEQVGKLGPLFIAESCVACHANNGRSLSPAVGLPFLQGVVKVGSDSVGTPHPLLGSVIQPNTTDGSSEGNVSISGYTFTNGTYGDGTPYTLRKPNFAFEGETPEFFSVRYSTQLVGLGLLEAIDENTILSISDPEDTNNDGISGRPAIVLDPVTGDPRLGRFTSKAGQASIRSQIAAALNTDMGITTDVFPKLDDGSTTPSAEVDNAELDEMNRYISLLAVSARRDLENPEALRGEAVFEALNCSDCHTPTMTTGEYHPMAELRKQTIHAYTDLLLHDMGPGLADNLGEGQASGAEWRTAPLWNIGLTNDVSGGEAYLHDGRARTLEEAILWHGGEGEASKEAFRNASSVDRDALIKFLKSL